MASASKSILLGNLAADPVVHRFPREDKTEGTVARFRIAVTDFSRKARDADGKALDEPAVDFFDITANGRAGEIAAQYLKKGAQVYLEARPRVEKWKDSQTGDPRSKVVFHVQILQLLGARPAGAPEQTQGADDDSVPF